MPYSSFVSSLFSSKSALALAAFAAVGIAAVQPAQAQDSVNAGATPALTSWNATEVGWDYMPTSSYSLTGIQTKFLSGLPTRVVTVEFYSAAPAGGGTLLRSGTFNPTSNTFSGATFSALSLTAGHNYFVGFRNVGSLGVNVTQDSGATALSPLHYDFNNNGTYSGTESGSFTSDPILKFESAAPVPEASTTVSLGLLLALGLGGLVVASRRKKVSAAR